MEKWEHFWNPHEKRQFIASIAPKLVSFETFWQMIIERRISVIVMLTDLQEGGHKKSDQYWPDRDNEVREIGSGISISIKHMSSLGPPPLFSGGDTGTMSPPPLTPPVHNWAP